jgi:hypothetical protein
MKLGKLLVACKGELYDKTAAQDTAARPGCANTNDDG